MDPPPKLSFGFGAGAGAKKPVGAIAFGKKPTAAAKSSASSSSTKKPLIFSTGDSDDESSNTPPLPYASSSTAARPKVSTATLSRAKKAKQAEELLLDSSVYEYDEVFDQMKAGEKQAELEKKKDSGERKPKYIEKLVETAAQRKQDRLRAEDKMVQRERDKEGDEFADKDAFVTPAYLAQQEEVRRLEAEEKRLEETNAGKSGGMSSFYKTYLDTNSKVHEAAVNASLSKRPVQGPSFQVEPPPEEKTEAELAAEVSAATGRRIEVNDDGIIIDKRELMSGGLNIVKKANASAPGGLGFSASIKEREAAAAAAPKKDVGAGFLSSSSGLSAAERGRQARERHSREMERQMLVLEEKRKREAAEILESKVQKMAKRNDETKVEKLKREAEERRKAREDAAKAAAT